MRSIVLRSFLVIGVGGLVLAGVLFVASTIDARPPEVLEINLTQPVADDARRGVITTGIEVVFSEPVEQSAAASLVMEPEVAGTVSWSGSTMIFTPHDPLELETPYVVRVAEGVRDLTGNEMAELPPAFEFVTAGRPDVVGTSPTDGESEVPLDQPIELTFSTLMDTASVEAELRLRPTFPHELRWSGALLEIVPTQPLRAGIGYEITVQADAADVAGVTIGEPASLRFRTVAPGLSADVLVPADGIEGIAASTPIAVIFDRPVDPRSVTADLLTITPEVAGTLEVERRPEDPSGEDGAGSVLRFTPSGPLPSNTTFEVELAPGITSSEGGGLAGPVAWSFTTGAPTGGISNQVTFITDRAGVPNVWAMNPDGSGKRQISIELVPVIDYAIAPDGSSLVVADGWRLIYQRADGSDRRVLTDEGVLEFDPTFAPGGRRVAFARADAETGAGLGLWEWDLSGSEPTPISLPSESDVEPSPSDPGNDPAASLRAPRYSPDGGALAFVDARGWVGLLELSDRRLARVPFVVGDAPIWLPDSGTVLLTGTRAEGASPATTFEAPVLPLSPAPGDRVYRLARAGTSVNPASFENGARALAVSSEGAIAYADSDGDLWLTDPPSSASGSPVVIGRRVASGTFAPGENAMVIVVAAEGERGSVELLDLGIGETTPLAPDGSEPRWLP